MNWERLGPIFNANGRAKWMHSHAYLPTAIEMDADRIRVFLAFRDDLQVGRLGWIDVSSSDPTRVIAFSERPALDIGRPGAFDDNGVTPLAVVRDGARLRMYYAGWQLTPRARYLLFTGLAFSDDGGDSFVRYQETPILDRTPAEFIVRTGAHVLRDEEQDLWKIWYAAGSAFVETAGKQVPTYHMAYLESSDGVSWPDRSTAVLKPIGPDEYGFGRPYIRKINGVYEMWHSVRSHSKGYSIGYATSSDGVNWQRQDRVGGLEPSVSGWDSEMTCFASVVENQHGTFLFYNGNGFGLTGVGVARLRK
ncbi:glucosyllhydrolase [Rhizobium freirei PRF 81]|uniref:Glucosyllhydrolase n=1 Tax=Rhizobium freirei PRF 81 TaxID=363754 RepID=N6UR75_9HYPH|nr:glycosyhydrolase [Rhizobium freirei]ENN84225.1 glucosyllhydrolase [Rhizobium freirei PRF 81]